MVIYINIIFYHLYIGNCDDLITAKKFDEGLSNWIF